MDSNQELRPYKDPSLPLSYATRYKIRRGGVAGVERVLPSPIVYLSTFNLYLKEFIEQICIIDILKEVTICKCRAYVKKDQVDSQAVEK